MKKSQAREHFEAAKDEDRAAVFAQKHPRYENFALKATIKRPAPPFRGPFLTPTLAASLRKYNVHLICQTPVWELK